MSDVPGQAKKLSLAPGAEKYQTLLRGGVSQADAAKWAIETTDALKAGGAKDEQIAEYWGTSAPKVDNPFTTSFKGGLAKNGYNPDEAKNPLEGWAAGWGYSVAGLGFAGHKPGKIIGPGVDLPTFMAATAGQAVGDAPTQIIGAIGGFILGGGAGVGAAAPTGEAAAPVTVPVGAVIGAGAGAGGLTEGARQSLLATYDYREGNIHTFADAMGTAGHALWETTKATVVGGVSSFVGGKTTTTVAGKLAAPVIGKVAGAVATGVTAVGVGSALNGRVPDAHDAAAAALLIVGGHVMGRVAGARVGARPGAPEVEPEIGPAPRPSAPRSPVEQAHNMAADAVNAAKVAKKAADAAPSDRKLAADALRAADAAKTAKANLAAAGAREAALQQAADEAAARHVEKSVQDAYVQEGVTPWEAANLAAQHPEIEQALKTQDVEGEPNLFHLRPYSPEEPEPYVAPAAKAPPPGVELPPQPARSHTAVSPQEAEELLLKLEGSHDNSVSPVGAIGRYQIMPGTARQYMGPNFDVSTLHDPAVNQAVGRRIIADLHRKYHGNMTAIAIAYNAGPGRASRYLGAGPGSRLVAVPDKKMRSGIRYESEASARDESWLPLETQHYLANGRRRSGGDMGASGGGAPPFPSFDPNALPESLRSAEGGGGGGEPPAGEPPRIEDDPWRRASEEDIVSEMMSNIGEDPKSQSLLNPDRLMRQFVTILNPARLLDSERIKAGEYNRDTDFGIEDAGRQTFASPSRAGTFIRHGIVDSVVTKNVIPGSPSIMSAIQTARAAGGDYAGYVSYRLALRADELAAQGKKSGVNPKAAAAGANHPGLIAKYDAASKMHTEVKRGALRYGLSSGLFNEERIAAMIKGNETSFHIARTKHRGGDAAKGKKGFRAYDPLKKMRGSDGQIIDPIMADVEDIRNIIRAADVNYFTGKIVGDPAKAAEAGFLLESSDAGTSLVTAEEAAAMKADVGGLDAPWLAEQASKVWEADAFPYFRDGKLEKWRAPNEDIAKMIRGVGSAEEADVIVEVAALASKVARTGVTAMMDFGSMSAVRGEIEAFLLDPSHPIPGLTFVRGLIHTVLRTDKYWDAQAKGAFGASQTSMDANWMARDMHHILNQTGVLGAMLNVAKHPLEAAQLLNDLLDNSQRLGAMISAEKQGREGVKAASIARTAHLDFMEAGTLHWVGVMSRIVPFTRPTILGMRRTARSFQEHTLTTLVASILGIAVPTALFAIWCHEQDKHLPVGQRSIDLDRTISDTHFVLPVVAGRRILIPYPQEVGLLFGSTVSRGLLAVRDKDPLAFEDWGKAVQRIFVPSIMPQALVPIAEHVTNQSLYSGRPLVPNSLAGASGYLQYTPSTSEVGKKLADILGEPGLDGKGTGLDIVDMSPIVFDNYVKGYAGSIGRDALRALDQPLGKTARPKDLADNPFVGTFFARKPGVNARAVQDFYSELDHLEQAQKDFTIASKHAALGDVSEIELTAKGADAASDVGELKEAVSNLVGIINGIYENKDLTVDEKRQQSDAQVANLIGIAEVGRGVVRSIRSARGLTEEAPDTGEALPDFSSATVKPAAPIAAPSSLGGAGEVPVA